MLTALVGAANVAGPTLSSLSHNFGLQPLIGKPAAIIADARLSGREDQAAIVERLLSISGEDVQTVDIKHRTPWTGALPTRFTIMSNVLPKLKDPSGAFAGRFVILQLLRSFVGREDPGLMAKLLPELPGILNWAIEGWQRLTRRGHFVQPDSAHQAMATLRDLANPVGAFVRDCCIVAPELTTPRAVLFQAFKQWCASEGRDHHGTMESFISELIAAQPCIRGTRPKGGVGQTRPPRSLEGVGLLDSAGVFPAVRSG